MSGRDVTLTLYLVLQFFFFNTCGALSCFAFDGVEYPDNQLCAGSSACCGVNSTCLRNRLCQNNGDPETTVVRGPCAVNPWNISVCAQICLYNESDSGNFFPRVLICSDGSLCCDDDRQCCQNNRGVFLDTNGIILTASPTSRTSTVVSTSSSISASSFATSSFSQPASTTPSTVLASQAATSSSSSESHGISTGSKVGLGVGIPFGVAGLAALGAIAYFLRRRGKANSLSEQVELVPSSQPYGLNKQPSHTPYHTDATPAPAPPLKDWHINEERRGNVRYEMPAGDNSPTELPSSYK